MSVARPRPDCHGPTPIELGIEAATRLDPPPPKAEKVRCPTPEHEDRNPSCTRYPDGGFKCWSCGAHGDALDFYAVKHGLTIKDALDRLGVLGEGHRPFRPRVVEPPYFIPHDLAQRLVESDQWARHWHLAKLLALPDPRLAQQDILRSWDHLAGIGYDIPLVWSFARLIRGEAQLVFGDASRATDPTEPGRAVVRLLRALEQVDAA